MKNTNSEYCNGDVIQAHKISRASVVQFRASQYIMHLNLTSVWKVMTIWIELVVVVVIGKRSCIGSIRKGMSGRSVVVETLSCWNIRSARRWGSSCANPRRSQDLRQSSWYYALLSIFSVFDTDHMYLQPKITTLNEMDTTANETLN